MTKGLVTVIVLASSIFAFSSAQAGSCGGGKITELKEGGWSAGGKEGLMLKIDYSRLSSSHSGTDHYGYIHFDANTLPAGRIEAIRRMAMLAFSTNRDVSIFSDTNNCAVASELTIHAS